MNKEACIVIPTYKTYSNLSSFEQKSLLNTQKVFKNYDVWIVCPEELNLQGYTDKGFKKFKVFDKKRFQGIEAYNELMLQPFFYGSFKTYRYMLIAQLDCFIFSDQLAYFCGLNYDYIGSLHTTPHTGNKLINGNGGFSLRNINSFIKASKNIKKDLNGRKDWEDILYSYWYKNKMNIAPDEVALKFGWQQRPEECFAKNGNSLPFGCHKPFIFNYNGFWKKYL